MNVSILACHPERAEHVVKLLNKTKYKDQLNIKIFNAYNDQFPKEKPDFLIIPGGGIMLTNEEKYPFIKKAKDYILNLDKKIPVLGLCLGHQLIGITFGGKLGKEKLDSCIRTVKGLAL